MKYDAFNLQGKVVLITGGNGGIGFGLAQELARAGANICIWGTNANKNDQAVEKLQQFDTKVHSMVCDVSSEESIKQCIGGTVLEFGRIDGCFANAGIFTSTRSILNLPDEEVQRILDVNFKGVFNTLKYAGRHMVERARNKDAGGRLVAISSLAALYGVAGAEHYASAKGAIVPLIKGMAVEFARYGITANTIMPGWIETAMTEKIFSMERFRNAVQSRIPLKRWGLPEDCGAIAVYLMSAASSYHTGDTMIIDGGYSIF